MANSVSISAGDVLEVQLTSETVVLHTPQGAQSFGAGHITNRMRLFIRESDGREKKYDFEDTDLGVREGQRVAVVQGRLKRAPEPVNLLLFNLSSGEMDAFEPGLAAYLHRPVLFGPPLKALAAALLVGVACWFVSRYMLDRDAASAGLVTAGFALLTFPIVWWASSAWDRITGQMRYRAARKRFINEMSARVQAYAQA